MQLEDLPEEVYNFNLSRTSPTFARIAQRYNTFPEEYRDALFRNGNLRFIQRYNLPFTDENIEEAVANGHLHVLIWAYEKGLTLTANLAFIAAEYGRIDILIWLKENGCPWNEFTRANAALNNHLDLLIWARGNEIPRDKWTCYYPALNGYLD